MTYSQEYKKQILGMIDGITKLMNTLNERQALERIGQQVGRIVSASNIEGNDEIASFASSINNLVNALAAGRVLPDNDIKSLLLDSLSQIRRSIEENHTTIDPFLTTKLKSVLIDANTSAKDYVLSRKITVMYVDEDDFVYSTICKLANNSMDIRLIPNASEARLSLLQEKFDVILCEIDLPDASGLELIKEFSPQYPVVAISGFDNPRQIQLATKAGAADFIVKDELGIRMIPRSLHTAFNEWERRKRGKHDEILDDPRAFRILSYLMNNSTIDQELKPSTFYRMQTQEPEKTIASVLDSLEQAKYVTRNVKALTLSCPRCHIIHLVSHFLCPRCNKSNFVRGDILEHNRCGYHDLEFAFQRNGSSEQLICPKCNKDLKIIGVDYLRTQAAYKCKECSNVFTMPDQRYTCSECNHYFKVSEGGWEPMYSYVINPTKVSEIHQKTVPLSSVKDYLASKGFSVDSSNFVNTKVQKFGPFEIVARKGDSILAMVILGREIEENHSKIIDLDTMSRTVASPVLVYAITFTELREVTRELLIKFGFTIISVKSSDQLLNRIKEYI